MNTRDDGLDSAKGVLIALVVLGHFLEATNYWDEDLVRYLLTAIYAFHMPAFVFLAGITSKPGNIRYRVAVLLSLLVIFQCLYYAYLPLTESNKQFEWADPFWALWFLLAMVWWLMALAIAQFAPRIALVLSVAVGLGSGAIPAIQYIPALDRALYFLPWFMAGYVIGKPVLDWVTDFPRGVTNTLLLASMVIAGLLWYFGVGSMWLYGSNGFAVLDVSVVHGLLMRTMLFLVAAVMSLALISLAARWQTVFVKAGKRSLAIYLLHGFFVLSATPWLGLAFEHYGPFAAILICLIATGLLTYLLSLSVFDRSLRALGSRSGGLLMKGLNNARQALDTAGARSDPGKG